MTLRKDAMEILRVFNNNVVLAKGGDGGEVILTGRGLGFQAKPGQTVDESKVVRTFVPSDGRDPDHLAQMLADIPPEIIRVVVESMQEAGLGERETGSTTLVMALSDHVANAVERVRRGIDITYPLLGEVSNLYPAGIRAGACDARIAQCAARRHAAGRRGHRACHASGQRRLRHRRPVLYVYDDGRDPATA